jgi:Mg2+ and Co2+ transporter CorA
VAAPWIDLVDPTADEIDDALDVPVDPGILDVLFAPPSRAVRASVERHGDAVVAVLTVPTPAPDGLEVAYLELDVVATRGAVLTVRKTGPAGELVGVPEALARHEAHTSGELVHLVVDDVCDRFLDLVDVLYGAIDELEDEVDSLPGPTVRRRLADLRHELLEARRAASATRAIVRRIIDGRAEVSGMPLFSGSLEHRFVDAYETLVRTTEELDIARDLLSSVRDYYQAKIAENQNEVGKKLTVVASIVLVPGLIVGFYGQNFEAQFDDPYWNIGTAVALIAVTTVAQLVFYRWRRWI